MKLLKHKVKTVSTLMDEKNMNLLLKLKLKASLYLTVQCLKFKIFAMNLGLDFKILTFGDYVPEAPATMFKGNY